MGGSSILFLSGAGLASWVWDEVRTTLPVESVVAAYPKRADARLRDFAGSALAQAPDGAFTIVAHSAGGAVAGEIVAVAPERVDGLLGIAASFPVAGASLLSALPVPQRVLSGLRMRVVGTRPLQREIRSRLCADLDDSDIGSIVAEYEIGRIIADFEPESQYLYRDRASPRTFPACCGYVVTTMDRQLTEALQHKNAAELGAGFRREIPTGHLPMVQVRASLARIVQEFAACT
ncbi:alpha/beta hydrolase [Nocardia brasiliensis]|uniref:alpha/beta hydrolase n=1 Tax=Nocardia brasiliensis TaxID=37326 RepID=UPI0024549DCE|nr:alpha/beta hydrolase [Nocardia brasiliensis]